MLTNLIQFLNCSNNVIKSKWKIQDHALHSAVLQLELLLVWNSSSLSLSRYWHSWRAEANYPVGQPSTWVCLMCLHNYTRFVHFGQEHRRRAGSVPSSASLSGSLCFQLDSQLTKLFFIMWLRWCLPCFSTLKLFYLLKETCILKRYFKTTYVFCYFLNFHSFLLTSIDVSYLNEWLLLWLTNGAFLIPSFPLHLSDGFLLKQALPQIGSQILTLFNSYNSIKS